MNKHICDCGCHYDESPRHFTFAHDYERSWCDCCELGSDKVKFYNLDGSIDPDRYAEACVNNVRNRREYAYQEYYPSKHSPNKKTYRDKVRNKGKRK